MEIEAQMAEDKRRHEEKLRAEEERDARGRKGGGAGAGAGDAGKKIVKSGAVKKPVVKRKARGF